MGKILTRYYFINGFLVVTAGKFFFFERVKVLLLSKADLREKFMTRTPLSNLTMVSAAHLAYVDDTHR